MNDAKDHILQTSLALFLQKSFKSVTMKEIVDKAGLSKGAFYHYFSSKEQVFSEVIARFFHGMMHPDFGLYAQTSLKAFYTDIYDKAEKNKQQTAQMIHGQAESPFSNNYYYLIFDAMSMLPSFRQQHQQEQKGELRAWKSVIGTARKIGEIKTKLTDEQIAKLFIYLGDGVNINLITADHSVRKRSELKTLWDALYATIQA